MHFGRNLTLLRRNKGFSLIELTVVVVIAGILLSVSVSAWDDWQDRKDVYEAVSALRGMELTIYAFRDNNGQFPVSLAAAGLDGWTDPWGNPYEYLNFDTGTPGAQRKDRNLVPINTDFDLYSKGKDGMSAAALTAASSRDDIVRGRDGAFMDLGEKF